MAVISSRVEISKKSRVMGNETAMLGKGGVGHEEPFTPR